MLGIKSFRAASDFKKVERDVQWWFSASIKAIVNRAQSAQDTAKESKVRLKAAQAYYEAVRETKLNQLTATETGYRAMVDCQVAEKRLRGQKKQLKQKLLEAGSSASKR